MCFSKLPKKLILEPDKKYCIRQIDLSEYGKKTTVIVGSGCMAVLYKDGAVEKYMQGKNFKVNLGKYTESLLCVSTDINYKLMWGTPTGVVYTDPETKLETTIGLNGTITVTVSKPINMILSSGEKNITPQYIKENVLLKISQIACAKLSMLTKGKKYAEVSGMASKLAECIGEQDGDLDNALNDMGLMLEDVTVASVHFPDDYLEARGDAKSGKSKNGLDAMLEEARREEKAQNDEGELGEVRKIAEMFKGLNPQQGAVGGKTCPHCGKVNSPDTAYCSKCGKKLN